MKSRLLYIILLAIVLVGCNNEPEYNQVLELPLQLCFSAPSQGQSSSNSSLQPDWVVDFTTSQSSLSPAHAPQQTYDLGDPGRYEDFKKPQYAYIFVVVTGEVGEIEEEVAQVTSTQDGQVMTTVVFYQEWTLNEPWNDRTYSGSLQFTGDRIYSYSKKLEVPYTGSGVKPEKVRVYAAMSTTHLTFNGFRKGDKWTDVNSEDEIIKKIEGLKFQTNTYAVQSDLKNIYSTPYNYLINKTIAGEAKDTYYAEFTKEELEGNRVTTKDILLYHVASRVDIMWNVPTYDLQQQMKITGIEIDHLYLGDKDGYSYLFRPMENTNEGIYGEKTLTDNSEKNNSYTLATNSIGTCWLGRNYIYTIPYNNTNNNLNRDNNILFPMSFKFTIQKTGENNETSSDISGNSYTKQVIIHKEIPSSIIFVPWIRGQFMFKTVPNDDTLNVESKDDTSEN